MKAYHVSGKVWSTDDPVAEAAEPRYRSFDEFINIVTWSELRKWCRAKAQKANRPRLLSEPPQYKVTTDLVLNVLISAHGRCCYCGSLCVEKAPTVNKKLAPWAHVGRRIGTLEHTVRRIDGGDNTVDNFEWCCYWCNTWASEQRPGATDHGGIQT